MYINTHVMATATWHCQHLHRVQRSTVLRRKSAGETECSLLLLLPPVLPALPRLLMLKSNHSQENCLQNDLFLRRSALLMHALSAVKCSWKLATMRCRCTWAGVNAASLAVQVKADGFLCIREVWLVFRAESEVQATLKCGVMWNMRAWFLAYEEEITPDLRDKDS